MDPAGFTGLTDFRGSLGSGTNSIQHERSYKSINNRGRGIAPVFEHCLACARFRVQSLAPQKIN
jgi:hypothetical protein